MKKILIVTIIVSSIAFSFGISFQAGIGRGTLTALLLNVPISIPFISGSISADFPIINILSFKSGVSLLHFAVPAPKSESTSNLTITNPYNVSSELDFYFYKKNSSNMYMGISGNIFGTDIMKPFEKLSICYGITTGIRFKDYSIEFSYIPSITDSETESSSSYVESSINTIF